MHRVGVDSGILVSSDTDVTPIIGVVIAVLKASSVTCNVLLFTALYDAVPSGGIKFPVFWGMFKTLRTPDSSPINNRLNCNMKIMGFYDNLMNNKYSLFFLSYS